jgi:hypothetical protein
MSDRLGAEWNPRKLMPAAAVTVWGLVRGGLCAWRLFVWFLLGSVQFFF